MGRLWAAVGLLVLVFSAAMALVCYGVWGGPWWISLIGVAVLLLFVALGGLLVPRARAALAPDAAKEAGAVLQMMGALVTTELLTAALMVWISGNRTLSRNNAYQVLGLLIFLGLVAVGAQGLVVTFIRWFNIYNITRIERRHSSTSATAPAH